MAQRAKAFASFLFVRLQLFLYGLDTDMIVGAIDTLSTVDTGWRVKLSTPVGRWSCGHLLDGEAMDTCWTVKLWTLVERWSYGHRLDGEAMDTCWTVKLWTLVERWSYGHLLNGEAMDTGWTVKLWTPVGRWSYGHLLNGEAMDTCWTGHTDGHLLGTKIPNKCSSVRTFHLVC